MNTFLYGYIILFPGELSAVFIILESMNKINCFFGHCFTFFSWNVVQVSTFFASVLLQIELNTLKFQNSFHTRLHIACVIFWPGNISLNPFSISILAISRLITLWALLLQQWDFKMLQHLSVFVSNTFPISCSWWKQIMNTLSFSFNNLALKAKYIANCHQAPWYFFFLSLEDKEVYHRCI